MWKEFKEFALKGNMLDMAIGVIIGGAFGKLVSSMVNDLLMPIFGYLTAGINFKDLKIVLSSATLNSDGSILKPEAAILYGAFIQNIIDFLIIALCIFFFLKLINKMKRDKIEEKEEKTPELTKEELMLMEIRDLLSERLPKGSK